MSESLRVSASPPSLNLSTELAYGSLQLANSAFATFSAVYLPFIYIGQRGLTASSFAWAILVATIVQVVIAPIIGLRIERVRSSNGRARILVVGAFLFGIGFALVAIPPVSTVHTMLTIWMFATLLLANGGRSVFEVSYTSMLADLTSAGAERTTMANLRQTFSIVGDVIASLAPGMGLAIGFAASGYSLFGIVMASWTIACSIWMRGRLQVDERFGSAVSLPSQEQWHGSVRDHLSSPLLWALAGGYSLALIGLRLVLGLFPFLLLYFGGSERQAIAFMLVVMTGSLLSLPLWGRLARNWGRRKALQTSLIASAVAVLGVLVVPRGALLAFLVLFFAKGAASSAITSFGVALQADLVDFEEMRLGRRSPATIAGIFVFTSRLSQGVGSALVAVTILSAGILSSPAAEHRLLLIYGLATAVIFGVSTLLLCKFPASMPVNS